MNGVGGLPQIWQGPAETCELVGLKLQEDATCPLCKQI